MVKYLGLRFLVNLASEIVGFLNLAIWDKMGYWKTDLFDFNICYMFMYMYTNRKRKIDFNSGF